MAPATGARPSSVRSSNLSSRLIFLDGVNPAKCPKWSIRPEINLKSPASHQPPTATRQRLGAKRWIVCPLSVQEEWNSGHLARSGLCHVWTAPRCSAAKERFTRSPRFWPLSANAVSARTSLLLRLGLRATAVTPLVKQPSKERCLEQDHNTNCQQLQPILIP